LPSVVIRVLTLRMLRNTPAVFLLLSWRAPAREVGDEPV
jgi:hypothetical protein